MTTLETMYEGVAGSPETILTVPYVAGTSATITVADASVLPGAPNRVVIQRTDLAFVTVLYGSLIGNVLGILTPEAGLITGTFGIGSSAARRFCEGDHKELRDNIAILQSNIDTVEISADQVVSGVFDVARIPTVALETVVTVADDATRYALSSAEVSIGDSVKVISTNKLWLVVDLDNLDSDAGYYEYTSALLEHATTHENGGADEVSIDASQITTGIIDIARIPHAAMEVIVIVSDDAGRFALTDEDVQLGDTVRVESTEYMFIVVDTDNLDSESGYIQYTALPTPHAGTHNSAGTDAISDASTTVSGLMAFADKVRLDGIEDNAEVNVIEEVKVGGTALTITSKSVDVPKASSSVLGVVKVDNVTIFADANAVISAKTTVTTDSASTTPTQILAHNNEYRFTNAAITTIGITVPSGLASDFIASVVWRNPASTATYTLTNSSGLTLKNSGTDVSAGTFTPVVSKTYNMIYYTDGVNLNCVIRGV